MTEKEWQERQTVLADELARAVGATTRAWSTLGGIFIDPEADPSEGIKQVKDESVQMSDVISELPNVRSFLDSRGKLHIDELDEQGKADLKAHMENLLAQARAENSGK